MAYDFLRGSAKAADIFTAIKSAEFCQLACLVVGVLSNRKPKVGGNAIVTDRLGRMPDNEIPDIF